MKLSVCIATYNGALFVIRQLDSVVKQLNVTDQLIVVDDGSTDNTVELIKQKYGDRIEVHVNEHNLGVIKSFEKAISLAKGDILFLCDQDDIWEDDKVEKVVKAFSEQDAWLVVHDAYVVDGNLEIINPSWNRYNGNNVNQGIIGNVLKNGFTGALMAFKKELVPAILPVPSTIEMHDQWIALVCLKEKRKIVYIGEPLLKYVRHGSNVTGMKKRPFSAKLKGRIGTVTAIVRYERQL
ncbi:alpha-L-Rha alpha-1,3-L-rhamnosyltransferase [Bacillus canaveralius]|uniref:Alpha-L-Rha alpha-1,3-L-rhamnosyltransferase n=1 Tax=Bacillus canaveralius TaxID=1403243 RepID=A0A2N5GML1_9BACI|nr:glycosyltransferase family 2 protein [Bacillus canaveralius]PLR83142.1 alpha-L-Rha alpha-1,3-L-rhamnosyltransferase [Bacillus canaveralius]PLR94060.1 alpha-L-Rha alpha-1,3-L-rhamnosyltransferase [Bacillus canaveralius]RSK54139.1 glycosyltransferase family 2 protein [Bacillus canaveralius]